MSCDLCSGSARSPIAGIERLGVIMSLRDDDPTEAWGVLNPATVRDRQGNLCLFPRVVTQGNRSRVIKARLSCLEDDTPIALERLGFALEPSSPYESGNDGAAAYEDPRIICVPVLDHYIMTYTNSGPEGAHPAVAVSSDLDQWERLGPLEFGEQDGVDFDRFENKDAFFFPEPVVGPDSTLCFACMHRPMTGMDQDLTRSPALVDLPSSMWVSYDPVSAVLAHLQALTKLRDHRLVIRPQYPWEELKVGGGTPPVLIADGWLLFYHGVANYASKGCREKLGYSAGAVVLDRLDPTKVIFRSEHPVMVPETEHERFSVVDGVVFPTGVGMVGDDLLYLYYGMADACIGVARVWLNPGSSATEPLEAS